MLTDDLQNEIEIHIPQQLRNLELVHQNNYVKGYVNALLHTEYLDEDDGIEKMFLSSLFFLRNMKEKNYLSASWEFAGYNQFNIDNLKLLSEINIIFKNQYGL